MSLESGDLSVQPLSGIDVLDLVSGDEGGPSAEGIKAGLGAVVRPFQADASAGIEAFQEVLDEGADGIDAAIAGVQPKSRAVGWVTGVRVELPVFRDIAEGRREVAFNLIAHVEMKSLVRQIESIFLSSFVGQRHEQAEVGEVIGHVFLSGYGS